MNAPVVPFTYCGRQVDAHCDRCRRGVFKAAALLGAFVLITGVWFWDASLLTVAADENLRLLKSSHRALAIRLGSSSKAALAKSSPISSAADRKESVASSYSLHSPVEWQEPCDCFQQPEVLVRSHREQGGVPKPHAGDEHEGTEQRGCLKTPRPTTVAMSIDLPPTIRERHDWRVHFLRWR